MNDLNEKQLENLRAICQKYMANQFSDAAGKAFKPPHAFARIPRNQQLAVLQAATIEFLAIQVASIINGSEALFVQAGGYEAMFGKLKDYIEAYRVQLKKETEEQDGTDVGEESKAPGQVSERLPD